MILKLKAFIYRHTGIYLAHKEQLAYMESQEYYDELNRISRRNMLRLYVASGILIGSWQAKHGFTRRL